jgi:serine/threonine-protein kinase HipA
MTVAAVRLWGRQIGAVSFDEDRRVASFEYDAGFRGSGIEVSPLTMPLADRIYQFPGLPEAAFRGLPGMLADSLPDRFGNALIDAWLAREGRTAETFDVVERLCYVGTRGMGALTYRPSRGPRATVDDVDVGALVELADAILRERKGLDVDPQRDEDAMNQILKVGTSAGGARAKAIIAWNPDTGRICSGQAGLPPGFEHWILKLDGVRSSDDHEVGATLGYGRIEYAYHRMARAAGIRMTECRLLAEGGRHHFMTRRFDRTGEGKKLHLQSLAALAHFDYNAAGAYSYEQAVDVMRRLSLSSEEIEEQFRRTVFNIVGRNQDDHVKNIAFLMDKRGRWSLSPAFDVAYAYNPAGAWTSRHQMSLAGKRDGFTPEDLLTFARFCNLKAPRAKRIISEVTTAVAAWPRFAREAGVVDARIEEVGKALRIVPGEE